MSEPIEIASQFSYPAAVSRVDAFGSGIINDTYVVTFEDPPRAAHPRLGKRAILQRINRDVFPDVNLIMHNLAVVLEHAATHASAGSHEFILPPIYKTKQDSYSLRDEEESHWRSIGFIEKTVSYNILQSTTQAQEVGAALGAFHQLLAGISVDKLHDTLPGFHDTPNYLKTFDEMAGNKDKAPDMKNKYIQSRSKFSNENQQKACFDFCFEAIEKHRSLAALLYELKPAVSLRIMHGDPKLNNYLFDQDSGKAVSIIDLDTVKPGIIHYDLGDCVRSSCNQGGEMPNEIEDATFSVKAFEAILNGYLSRASGLFDHRDFGLLYDIVKLLPFELGIRFFSDYLNGNRYFKVDSADDNLYRARVQFQLIDSIESQSQQIQHAISQCKASMVR